MAVVAQYEGTRIVAFQKCGHASLINTFLTPAGEVAKLRRGAMLSGALKGTTTEARDWPDPDLTIAFFRHPLERAISAYENFFVRTWRTEFEALGFTPDMSFVQFLSHLTTIDLSVDAHLKPQAISYFEGYLHSAEVYAGRLEQVGITWPLVVEQYNLHCTKNVAHFNTAFYAYDQYILPQIHIAPFRALYADDYALWEAANFEARTPISSECH